jgi:hypothetical protein
MTKASAYQGLIAARTAGILNHVPQAESAEGGEPEHHHRAEQRADRRRAMPLKKEQQDQDGNRGRQNVGIEQSGVTTSSPSTAESTDIAGVITASP